MRHGNFVSGVVLACALATLAGQPAAHAADVQAAPEAFDWSGAYVGGDIGWLGPSGHWDIGSPGNSFFGPTAYSGGGVTGGLHLGYNWQVDAPFVLGVEVDWGLSNAEASSQTVGGLPAFGGSATSRWQGSARARVGAAFDRMLLYGTAGVSVAKFDYWMAELPPVTKFAFSATRTGVIVGAGLEYALARDWSVRVEYRHADYGKAVAQVSPIFGEQRHALRTDSVQFGFSYKFN